MNDFKMSKKDVEGFIANANKLDPLYKKRVKYIIRKIRKLAKLESLTEMPLEDGIEQLIFAGNSICTYAQPSVYFDVFFGKDRMDLGNVFPTRWLYEDFEDELKELIKNALKSKKEKTDEYTLLKNKFDNAGITFDEVKEYYLANY